MNLKQYVKILYFLYLMMWNIIKFLYTIFPQKNIVLQKKASFFCFKRIDTNLNSILYNLKEFINKKILKENNTSTAKELVAVKHINKNKISVLNRIYTSTIFVNMVLKNSNSLYIKRLKDAPATQILISKQHFFRLQDKCAFLYPFVSKNHCSQYNL